ncbi:unnamed protein product [Ectocarpus sp. 6 AP-2014]
MNGGTEKLRLLSVIDKETGVCLFQRAWQWRGEQERSSVSIGKLVQSFYQFAREVDQGEISCVNFLVKSRTHRRVSSSQAARRTRGPSARSLPDSMQMLCTRNEDIIVAVFFDVKTCVTTSTENQGSVRQFINQASNSFCETFAGRVASLRPTLKQCADGDMNDAALRSVQDEFLRFGPDVDQMRHVCFTAAA